MRIGVAVLFLRVWVFSVFLRFWVFIVGGGGFSISFGVAVFVLGVCVGCGSGC